MTLRIAVDVDGILAKFEVGFYRAANELWPGRVDPNHVPGCWDFYAELGMTKEEFGQVWGRVKETRNFWLTLPDYTENVVALHDFLYSATGPDEIYYVTSRVVTAGDSVAQQTSEWLLHRGLLPLNASVIVVPTPDSKRAVYEALRLDASIDDHGPTAEMCSTLLYHEARLHTRKWNLDREYAAKRVGSLAEFLGELRHGTVR